MDDIRLGLLPAPIPFVVLCLLCAARSTAVTRGASSPTADVSGCDLQIGRIHTIKDCMATRFRD